MNNKKYKRNQTERYKIIIVKETHITTVKK